MNLQDKISQQRIDHIVRSYNLDGDEKANFSAYLSELTQAYPLPLIELSLVETMVENWLTVPFQRGVDFLVQAHARLQNWESQPIVSTLTSEQFSSITGLDPFPVFGAKQISCSVQPS
ncbi:MAG: hypothetical protein WBA10_13770 [Elainellaceae cyanobacterium]